MTEHADRPPSPPGWLAIPASTLQESGTLWLHEPESKNRQLLIHQLRDGIYPHPFVIDDGKVRRLHFNLKLVQSEMRIAAPYELALAYTQAMMAFLLFVPRPKHVVIIGLGGGSLTKYCHRHLARSRITAVELSAGVIACRDWFMLPPDDERLRIMQADAADYFAAPPDTADAILLDAYDEDGVAPQLCSLAFYQNVRAHLKPQGVLVTNISGHGLKADTHVALIEEAFQGRCVSVDISSEGNRIVYAFRDPAFPPLWQKLERTAAELDTQHGFNFARILRDMERAAQRSRRKKGR